MDKKVVVTGLGFITCIGNDQKSVIDSLRELKSGISEEAFLNNPDLAVKAIGKPPGFEFSSGNWRKWKMPPGYPIDLGFKRSLSPQGICAVGAVEQALADAGLAKADLTDGETGLYGASAGSALLMGENLKSIYASEGARGNPMGLLSSIAGTLNFNLGSWLGIRGTNCGYISACSSGAHAVGYGWDDLVLGRQKRAIVIGAEDPTAETVLSFSAMRVLSENPEVTKASRPFDRDRDGFVGAGGATVVILEEEGYALARGAKIYAEVAGWGQVSDGFHRASPHPEGRGLAGAMRKALESAGIQPVDVDHVCAHATSTQAGDLAEARALGEVFKGHLDAISISSPKGLTGHSLSMAGVLELAICALMLDQQFSVGNTNLEHIDPACGHLNLSRATEDAALTWVLNNSSGFGGSNVCNVLKRYSNI